jgi:HNH endonuclease/AP2 domain
MITQEYLKSILYYNLETGIWTWIKPRPKIKVGSIAGGLDEKGYWKIKINGKKYLAHRLAHLYVNGAFPPFDTDHKDLNRSNNKWNNIREATRVQNFGNQSKYSNNKSGIKGVCWDRDARKWLAQIQINNKKMKLGRFDNIIDAQKAYATAAWIYFGEFARTE